MVNGLIVQKVFFNRRIKKRTRGSLPRGYVLTVYKAVRFAMFDHLV